MFTSNQLTPQLFDQECYKITLNATVTNGVLQVSWNIPTPYCGNDLKYNGCVVVASEHPIGSLQEQRKYIGDPTLDSSLHRGDRINGGFVIGAFYGDTTTNNVIVPSVTSEGFVYVTIFPVTNDGHYFVSGIHNHVFLPMLQTFDCANGEHVIGFNVPEGIEPTDATGLLSGVEYSFDAYMGLIQQPEKPNDPYSCITPRKKFTVTVNGTSSQTFGELVVSINNAFTELNAEHVGTNPPMFNTVLFDGKSIRVFDGSVTYITQPTVVGVGSYSHVYDGRLLDLLGSPVPSVVASVAPTNIQCGIVWYNGTQAYTLTNNGWVANVTHVGSVDPSLGLDPSSCSLWLSNGRRLLSEYDVDVDGWKPVQRLSVIKRSVVTTIPLNTIWKNGKTFLRLTGSGWVPVVVNAGIQPPRNGLWFDAANQDIYDATTGTFITDPFVVANYDPTLPAPGVYFVTDTDVYVYSTVSGTTDWHLTDAISQDVDPRFPIPLNVNDVWVNDGIIKQYKNGCFTNVGYVVSLTDPLSVNAGIWLQTLPQPVLYEFSGSWQTIGLGVANLPYDVPSDFWNVTTQPLVVLNPSGTTVTNYVRKPTYPAIGMTWLNDDGELQEYTLSGWVLIEPFASVEIDCKGNFRFRDRYCTSTSRIEVVDVSLFASLVDVGVTYYTAKNGNDAGELQPTYATLGIGTTGSRTERLRLMEEIRMSLGHPVVQVELTEEQLDFCISLALKELRMRSSICYRREFFMMPLEQGVQTVRLTNKEKGHDRIVSVLGIYRVNSLYLNAISGSGPHGYMLIQQLFTMGAYDLVSYELQGQYSKLMEQLFSSRIQFGWNEHTRELKIYRKLLRNERIVCLETATERPEQEILVDRQCTNWIKKFSLAHAKLILAEIRGKYGSLPGAGGTVQLNASDLKQSAEEAIQHCMEDIDNGVVDNYEVWGSGPWIAIG